MPPAIEAILEGEGIYVSSRGVAKFIQWYYQTGKRQFVFNDVMTYIIMQEPLQDSQGPSATAVFRKLASMLVDKWSVNYSRCLFWLRCRLFLSS